MLVPALVSHLTAYWRCRCDAGARSCRC